MLAKDVRVRSPERLQSKLLRKGNFLSISRSSTEGKIVWGHLFWPAMDLKTGKFNLKIYERNRFGKWQLVKIE